MKALSLWQPWATLWAVGAKRVESRGWHLSHVGALAVHATASIPALHRDAAVDRIRTLPAFYQPLQALDYGEPHKLASQTLDALPFGAIVGVVIVTVCVKITGQLMRDAIAEAYGPAELDLGFYDDGRFAIHSEAPILFGTPIPCKGGQRVWNVPPEILPQLWPEISTSKHVERYRHEFQPHTQSEQ